MRVNEWDNLKDKRALNGNKKRFPDEALKLYTAENPNKTLKEVGHHFSVSDVAILKRLRKAWYSFKKKRWNTEKEMKQKEESGNFI